VLGVGADVGPDADFFQDLGGDSLFAAELVTSLRSRADMTSLTVRDVYAAPSVARLAERVAALSLDRAAPHAAEDVDPGRTGAGREAATGRPLMATALQTIWLLIELALLSVVIYAGAFVLAPLAVRDVSPLAVALWLPVVWIAASLVYVPAAIAFVVLVKRLVVGRYRAGRSPVWGSLYVRHWIVRQTLRFVPWRWLEGTVFQLAALRALGARVGKRVHIHRGVDLLQGGWDLLDIGDDVTIGQEVVLRLVDLEDEQVIVGPIAIGAGATLETRSSVAGGATLESGAYLTALSSLPAGARIPPGERWTGVPAAPSGRAAEPPTIDAGGRVLSPFAHGLVMLAGRMLSAIAAPLAGTLVFALVAAAANITVADLTRWLRAPFGDARLVWAIVAASIAAVPLSVFWHLTAMRLLGRVPPGVISRWSTAYLRVWAKTDLVRRAGDWLSGALTWPIWLRAAGMRIGRDSEVSTIIDVVPELISIGPGTFFADGVYLGSPQVHRGTVSLQPTQLGAEVFLGNHVVIPAGATIGEGVLIGVSTVAGADAARPGSAWFGHPPFALSRPPAPAVDRRLTHEPSMIRRLNRWAWELARFVIPVVPTLTLLAFASLLLRAADRYSPAAMALLVLPLLVTGAGALLCGLVLALKWLLLGRVRPAQHALWSCWCSRWDFLYVAWGRLARPFLARFDGTLWLAWYLRAMGMRIGRRVVLGPGFAQVVDPDMIRIDDDATVHALFQAHTFEDRVLKIDRIRIRRRATVGCGAVLFYGVDIGEGAQVEAQSVIMKNERLAPHRRYEGAPAGVRTVLSRDPVRPDRSVPQPAPSAVRASS
jgi:non-ribosomal peptide synthetase-like protein